MYIDLYKDVFIVAVIAIVDTITIFKVHIVNVQMRRSGTINGAHHRRNKEINFLKQAVLQAIIFAIELYTYFHLAWHFQNKWVIFGLTTIVWNLTHCCDALIIIGLNAEFRKFFTTKPNKINSNGARIATIDKLSERRSIL
ncbi:unnamed protein product [Cylicocyclus nassatus]|uniref:7TM GPCR serpentine receptor class x (Srx) domain-containing protein n=1 Tax=Cylicocyclus nassatus TaxID=53992 RepID=A0AA36DJQ7_CYLNA|nr:unnamed protein product [Cylicocyclus nassatus]